MAKGLDKGATQLRIEGLCRDSVAEPAGCTLCGSNDHPTTGCPMRAQEAPRQPEGGAHKHEAQSEVAQNTDSRSMTNKLSSQGRNASAFENRMGELQVENGKLRQQCERLRLNIAEYNEAIGCYQSERDTLRQQLAERDATIARLEEGIPRIQEQSHQMRQQRDRLAGLLYQARDYVRPNSAPGFRARIDAALAEVNK